MRDPDSTLDARRIARRVRALLALRGEEQRHLEARLGTSQTSVWHRLSGNRPYSGQVTIQAVADTLGVPPSTLLSGSPWPCTAPDCSAGRCSCAGLP